MPSRAFVAGELIGLLCGIVLVSFIISYIAARWTGGWTIALFGYVLLAVAIMALFVSMTGGRKHAEPIA